MKKPIIYPTEDEVKTLKEAEQDDEGGCGLIGTIALVVMFALLVAPVMAVRSRQATPGAAPAVAQATAIKEYVPTYTRPALAALPLATATPAATYTPQPTFTPLATLTPWPTYTAAPSQTPPPTWTPPPSSTPTLPPATATIAAPVATLPGTPLTVMFPDDRPTEPAGVEWGIVGLLASAIVYLALLLLFGGRLVVQPAPLVIESPYSAPRLPAGETPLPSQAFRRAWLRPLAPPEKRLRRVEPTGSSSVEAVEPVQPTAQPGPTDGGGGVEEITLPFDRTRPPTAKERAYIRRRYQELQSLTAVCRDVYGVKSGGPMGTFTYVKMAIREGQVPQSRGK